MSNRPGVMGQREVNHYLAQKRAPKWQLTQSEYEEWAAWLHYKSHEQMIEAYAGLPDGASHE